jgi:hypothetical protein
MLFKEKTMKMIDMTGQRFGRFTVIKYAGRNKQGKALWSCKCDCGVEKIVGGTQLRNGTTKSCGCYNRERSAQQIGEFSRSIRNYKMGYGTSRLANTWRHMIHRCENVRDKSYPNYGGRGIRVCDEWHDFFKFQEWALENGYDANLTIDRIDNDKGYNPDNCRWSTKKQQSENRRNVIWIDYHGNRYTATEWARLMGGNKNLILKRLSKGWNLIDAITQKP